MRLKIIAGNLAVVLILGLVAFFTVSGQLKSGLVKQLDSNIDNDRLLLERTEEESLCAGRLAPQFGTGDGLTRGGVEAQRLSARRWAPHRSTGSTRSG